MEEGNHSVVTEFILSGLTDHPELQAPLFVFFLLIYVIALVGNGGLILLITADPQLHTPMYFFLRTLSVCDLCYSMLITPNLLKNFLADRKSISHAACALQMYFSILLSDIECLLLVVMAYDRYVAICNPLRYMVTMSRQRCNQLVAGVCAVGLVDAMILTYCVFRLSFCCSNIIGQYFCEMPPLLVLSCSDTSTSDIVQLASICCILMSSAVTIFLSYVFIISTILWICSAEGRYKAFSTCTCHLITVGVFYFSILFMYFKPTYSSSTDIDKIASVFYTLVIPMLNPLIYSLSNREVKGAFRKAMKKLLTSP